MPSVPALDRTPIAVAVDLDGTLLNSQSRVSERNLAALESCFRLRIPVIIATSRPARSVRRLVGDMLSKRCSMVLMNGAVATGNPPLSGSYRESLSEDSIRGVIDFALAFDPTTRITIEVDGYEFGANWQVDPATLWERNSATPDMVLPLDEAMHRDPCKVALSCKDVLTLGEQLSERFGESASVVAAKIANPLVNVTSRTATKPAALARLVSAAGLSLNDVLAFGDDLPDIGMLEECGMSVAMGNAFPEVKKVCAYLTASNDDDGVALVIERMLKARKD